jgi:hypothetical protein
VAVHTKLIYKRSALATEDAAVTSHDFNGADWDGTALAAVAARIVTWWTVIKPRFPTQTSLLELRVYNGYDGDGSPGQVDMIHSFNLPGTGGGNQLPPQCACSVTEELYEPHLRRHWGRFYLPNMAVGTVGSDGRFLLSVIEDVATATQAWYNGMKADGRDPIVWVSAAGGGIAEIDGIRVDDIVDIQRRRRWDTFANRVLRDLTD